MRAEKWGDAVAMLLRFAASCDASGARNSQCKAYLGAVVVWLYAGKANDAWVTYQASAALRRGAACLAKCGRCAAAVGSVAATTHSSDCLHLSNSAARAQYAGSRRRRCTFPTPISLLHPLQDSLGVDAFSSSDEAFAADALFDAYRRSVCLLAA